MVESPRIKLQRSNNDRILFGVCGGIAERYDLDPTLVRAVWVLLTILTLGIGIIVYLIAALVIPEFPKGGYFHAES